MNHETIAQIRSKMHSEFDLSFCNLTIELFQERLSKTKEIKEKAGINICNWSAHDAGDYFYNLALEKYPAIGIVPIRKSIKGYNYCEIQTESFKLYPILRDNTYVMKNKAVLKIYSIYDDSDSLFPGGSSPISNNDKIPFLLICDKDQVSKSIKSIKVIARYNNSFDEKLSYQIFPIQNINSENSNLRLAPENSPDVLDYLQIRDNKKVKTNEES
ncbi:hypothetical protein [Leptospira terpstrae]|uniref:Uncharacterized protein n=1 Tax=Leptospira terpstrae serovar Hualin str. LT 11-33 = ATCC 700639 TaxID=1257025 RepID=N1VUK8_9LEPT|nr:hypothetical protein [Leptospira terpstrae]EMY60695.1 hypothetical protein LEP1GSC203_0324 [Leptospira terpstrae serovar Hualin str. LT 11-33 = ATCC 700639]